MLQKSWKNKQFSVSRVVVYIAFIALVAYLNLTTRGFGLDLIILFFGLLALLSGRGKEFFKDWWPYLVLFWLYETARGFADNIAQFLGRPIVVDGLLNLERAVFGFWSWLTGGAGPTVSGVIPTVWLQQHFLPSQMPMWFIYALFLVYTLFFWFWAFTGYVLWKQNKKLFHEYMQNLLIVSFIGVVFYALMPSAPPWYAAYLGKLPPLDRFLWSKTLPSSGISLVHFWDQNYFAAFPSMHFAWPFLAVIYLTKVFGGFVKSGAISANGRVGRILVIFKKLALYSLYLIPFAICFAIVYGAEHYVVDCLMSVILVLGVVWGRRVFRSVMGYFVKRV